MNDEIQTARVKEELVLGRTVLQGRNQQSYVLNELKETHLFHVLSVGGRYVSNVAFSLDGHTIACGIYDDDRRSDDRRRAAVGGCDGPAAVAVRGQRPRPRPLYKQRGVLAGRSHHRMRRLLQVQRRPHSHTLPRQPRLRVVVGGCDGPAAAAARGQRHLCN